MYERLEMTLVLPRTNSPKRRLLVYAGRMHYLIRAVSPTPLWAPLAALAHFSRVGLGFAFAVAFVSCGLSCAFSCVAPASAAAASAKIDTPDPISGHNPSVVEEVLPADVRARVLLVAAEIAHVRRELGVAATRGAAVTVKNAAPREVFFQAVSLFRKCNQLAFEHTGYLAAEPVAPKASKIRPMHVWRAVDAALRRVLATKQRLGIPERSVEKLESASVTPSDVFNSIVVVDRQINAMLLRRTSPGDVYREISLAIHYSARLLARFDGVERLPNGPPFVRAKLPLHVFQRLTANFAKVREIAQLSGLSVLDLQTGIAQRTRPGDVYDLATLLVSELAYVHANIRGAPPPVPVHHPGIRFPSHCFARAGMLEGQLDSLLVQVGKNANWLKQ